MTDISNDAYNLSFTAASLRPELARVVAHLYEAHRDWRVVKEMTLGENSLQCRTRSSLVRMEGEIRQRLQHLTEEQLSLLSSGTTDDATAMAWLAVCKHTPFAFGFAAEVLRDKLAQRDPTLRPSDYEAYFEGERLLHPELDGLKPSSRMKIRQVLFKMLAEAGLVRREGRGASVVRPVIPPAAESAIRADRKAWLAAFLRSESEI